MLHEFSKIGLLLHIPLEQPNPAHAAHPFEPQGVSEVSIVLLAKSHTSVHTYPKYHACFIDFLTCGEQIQAKSFARYL